MEKIKIGIIGAGQGSFALLQVLKDIAQVEVVGICDTDPTAPALIEASNLSIPTYLDADTLIREQPLDWLINVAHISITHRHILSRDLKEVTVIDGQIAELLWRLLIDFHSQAETNKEKNLSSEEQAESFYTLSWSIIQQVVAIIQPVQKELEQIAFHDPLTGIYSRRILMEFLEREISRAYRQKRPLAVVIADIDRFKPVNDQFGHEKGDEVLKGLAEILKNSVRGSDLAARYGGEEFVTVLPNTDLAAATLWAERMCERVRETLKTPDDQQVTISLGVTALSFDSGSNGSPSALITSGALINRADQALYQAKDNGRNQVVAIAPEIDQ
jgi:diguanylate cyclase (GGDEF)-like protein